ncbi:MAG: hypothetical protein MUC38_06210 [Cyclobacteriaceae bacterium]|jgi:hypothetical protein|nr:hypothetical protein [Cyclobacteriaceae bacterium]
MDPLRNGENKGPDLQLEALQKFAKLGREFSGIESGLRLLPYAVAEQFGIRRSFKPISLPAISIIWNG